MNQCATSSTYSFLLLQQINPTQTSAEGLILHLRQASRSLLNDGMFNQQIPQSDIWWSTIQSAKCSFHGPNVLAATQTRLFIKEKSLPFRAHWILATTFFPPFNHVTSLCCPEIRHSINNLQKASDALMTNGTYYGRGPVTNAITRPHVLSAFPQIPQKSIRTSRRLRVGYFHWKLNFQIKFDLK